MLPCTAADAGDAGCVGDAPGAGLPTHGRQVQEHRRTAAGRCAHVVAVIVAVGLLRMLFDASLTAVLKCVGGNTFSSTAHMLHILAVPPHTNNKHDKPTQRTTNTTNQHPPDRTVASGEGGLEYLATAAGLQQFKQTALAYVLLLGAAADAAADAGPDSGLMGEQEVAVAAEGVLQQRLQLQVGCCFWWVLETAGGCCVSICGERLCCCVLTTI